MQQPLDLRRMVPRSGLRSFGPALRFDFRDLFSTDRAAGAVNGTAAEPGPGVRTVTGSGLSISGGVLVLPNAATNSIYWSKVAGQSDLTRVAGRCVGWRFPTMPTAGTGYINVFEGANRRHGSYHAIQSGAMSAYVYEPAMNTTAYIRAGYNHPNAALRERLVLNADHVRNYFDDQLWTQLAWLSLDNYSSNVKFGSDNVSLNGSLDDVEIFDTNITALTNGQTLDVTNPTANTDYEATAAHDLAHGLGLHIIDLSVATAAGSTVEIFFRYYDADNYHSVQISQSAVLWRWRTAGANTDNSTAITLSDGDTLRLYARLSEKSVYFMLRRGTSKIASHANDLTIANHWTTMTDPTVRYSTSGFAVSSWRAWALVSSDYGAINTARTGKTIMSVGDSKTSDYGWQNTLLTSLNNLAVSQWAELPGMLAVGGRTVATTQAVIDAEIANRFSYPDHVLINLGSNDVGGLPAEATWKANYRYIIEALHAAYSSAKIYLAKPVRLSANPPSSPVAACATLWDWIDDLAAEYAYVYAGIDETALQGADNYATNLVDITHYTAAGKTAVAALWAAVLG